MQTIADVMIHEVVTIPSELSLRDAAALLNEKNISGAPVVDEHGALIGVLSESDLLNEARKRAAIPRTAVFGVFVASEETLQRLYHFGADLPVRTVMSSNLTTVEPTMSVTEAAQLLVKKKINRLPVVDSAGKLVGIVTREDLLRAVFAL